MDAHCLRCSKCDEPFQFIKNLKRHEDCSCKNNNDDSKSTTAPTASTSSSYLYKGGLYCSECGMSFTLPKNRRRHEQYSCKKTKDEKMFKCLVERCDAAYSRMDGLLSHLNAKHKGDEDFIVYSKAWYDAKINPGIICVPTPLS